MLKKCKFLNINAKNGVWDAKFQQILVSHIILDKKIIIWGEHMRSMEIRLVPFYFKIILGDILIDYAI